MNHVQTRLTFDDFENWIRALRYATKKYTMLHERLVYCNLKLTCGHGSSLDRPLQKVHPKYNPFLHWIESKDKAAEDLEAIEEVVKGYEAFSSTLSDIENVLLSHLILKKTTMSELAMRLELSRTTMYTYKNGLLQKWVSFFSPSK